MNEPHELYPRLPYLGKPYENLSIWLATLPEAEQWHWLAFQPARLMAENAITRYYLLVTNFEFIEAKLKLIGIKPLLCDYELAIFNGLVTKEMRQKLKIIRDAVDQLGKLYQEYPTVYAEWIQFCKVRGISPQVPYIELGIPLSVQKRTLLQIWLEEKHPDFAIF